MRGRGGERISQKNKKINPTKKAFSTLKRRIILNIVLRKIKYHNLD